MKKQTREEIEQEWEVAVRTADYEHTHKLRVLAERRNAALAELDDPMLRLLNAMKTNMACYECGPLCIACLNNLRAAIDYAEQRRSQA